MNGKEDMASVWVFLSHSNRDFDDVRRLRDLLEAKGHKPIMFYLKCLDDHPNDEELWALIEREIDARDWFFLCDSPNARESQNVRREIEIITTRPEKVYETIAIKERLEPQMSKIDSLLKRATVFLSYSHHDKEQAAVLRNVFEGHDYAVFSGFDSLRSGEYYVDKITGAIQKAVRNGFVILLLSEASLASHSVLRHIQFAFTQEASEAPVSNVIPVALSDSLDLRASMPPKLQFLLGGVQITDFSKGDLAENTRQLISHLKVRTME